MIVDERASSDFKLLISSDSQGRLVFPLIRSIGMSRASIGGETANGAVISSAVFAGVFILLAAFIEGMLALIIAIGMPRARV